VHSLLGLQLLQSAFMVFYGPKPLCLVKIHIAEFFLRLVMRAVTQPAILAQLPRRYLLIRFSLVPNDPIFCKTPLVTVA